MNLLKVEFRHNPLRPVISAGARQNQDKRWLLQKTQPIRTLEPKHSHPMTIFKEPLVFPSLLLRIRDKLRIFSQPGFPSSSLSNVLCDQILKFNKNILFWLLVNDGRNVQTLQDRFLNGCSSSIKVKPILHYCDLILDEAICFEIDFP